MPESPRASSRLVSKFVDSDRLDLRRGYVTGSWICQDLRPWTVKFLVSERREEEEEEEEELFVFIG